MRKSLKNTILNFGFYGTLFFGLLAHFFHSDMRPPALDTSPEPGKPFFSAKLDSLAKFTTSFDKWYLNHFPYRNLLLSTSSHFKNLILKSPSSDSVLFGKNGHLFFTGQSNIESYQNLIVFNNNQISSLLKKLEERAVKLNQQNIKYLIVIAPNPHTIYSENLPNWIQKVRSKSDLDVFSIAFKDNPHFAFIDLRPALMREKKKWQIYHLTDTHWNSLGAFVCYQEILSKVAQLFKSEAYREALRPLDLDHDFILHKRKLKGGDLANMLGLSEEIQEEIVDLERKKPSSVQIKEERDPHFAQLRRDLMSQGRFTAEQSKNFTTWNPKIDPNLRALVFRDSYFSAVTPFLSENFNEVKYIWNDGFFDEKEIQSFRPTLVIQEIVERSIHSNL